MIPAVGTPKTDYRNSVRIIGGAWRGRRIVFPDLPGLRPTPDRVRETLFNWLQHIIPGARCLDLFAGSGALGLEALSRGAREVVFVEQAALAAQHLRTQILHLHATASANMLQMDAGNFLRSAPQAFDLVFLDPPFGSGALSQYVALLDAGKWLSSRGLVYLEDEKSAGVPTLPQHWELLKSKFAGEVGYHLVRVNRQIQPNE
jgi:16S rRNA (guanine966-N2)-methyltransferase